MKPTSMRTLTVSLTQAQASRMQQAIATGGYASNSEIVREALRLWEQREELRALEMEHLRRAYAEGKASGAGEAVDRQAFLADLKSGRPSRA